MRSARILTAVIAAVIALSAVAVLSDGSDADVGLGNASADGFSENHSGTVEIPITNTSDETVTVTLTATYTDSGKEIESQQFEVAPGTATYEMSFKLSSGTKDVTITASGDDVVLISGAESVSLEIDVESSLWSDTTTYVAIILVAIVIVIAVVLYLRSKPKEDKKDKMTFTELEAQKKAGAPEKAEEKAPSTQRRRYSADSGSKSQRNEAPAKAEEKAQSEPTHVRKSSVQKEESKPASFTELEAQKKAAKSEDGSKDKGAKKLKYKSS